MTATASPHIVQAARQALTLMDLTSLNDNDTDSTIEALCQQVKTPFGTPAAVCVYPQFIVTAQRALTAHLVGTKRYRRGENLNPYRAPRSPFPAEVT